MLVGLHGDAPGLACARSVFTGHAIGIVARGRAGVLPRRRASFLVACRSALADRVDVAAMVAGSLPVSGDVAVRHPVRISGLLRIALPTPSIFQGRTAQAWRAVRSAVCGCADVDRGHDCRTSSPERSSRRGCWRCPYVTRQPKGSLTHDGTRCAPSVRPPTSTSLASFRRGFSSRVRLLGDDETGREFPDCHHNRGGVILGSPGGLADFPWIPLLHALFGTVLVASGAATLNQWMERQFDARMRRTAGRPVAAGASNRVAR